MASSTQFNALATPDVSGHQQTPVVSEKTMPFGEYMRTRFSTLKPPMTKIPSPFKTLSLLNRMQWLNFAVAFAAWSWDAFDFFTVSLTLEELAESFGKTKADITWGISIAVMLRSVGSLIFGLAADRYGRKWPFVVNNIMFIVIELLSGFCVNFEQFMVCRAFFGVSMGGIRGNAVATALEDCPAEARGIVSGNLQQGYAFGYLMATVATRALVGTTSHGWRPLFWFGACPPVLIILFRIRLPETQVFQERQRQRQRRLSQGRYRRGQEELDPSRLPGALHGWYELYVARLPGPVPDAAQEHQPVQRRPSDCDAGDRQRRCDCRWHARRLLLAGHRSSSQSAHGVHLRRVSAG